MVSSMLIVVFSGDSRGAAEDGKCEVRTSGSGEIGEHVGGPTVAGAGESVDDRLDGRHRRCSEEHGELGPDGGPIERMVVGVTDRVGDLDLVHRPIVEGDADPSRSLFRRTRVKTRVMDHAYGLREPDDVLVRAGVRVGRLNVDDAADEGGRDQVRDGELRGQPRRRRYEVERCGEPVRPHLDVADQVRIDRALFSQDQGRIDGGMGVGAGGVPFQVAEPHVETLAELLGQLVGVERAEDAAERAQRGPCRSREPGYGEARGL